MPHPGDEAKGMFSYTGIIKFMTLALVFTYISHLFYIYFYHRTQSHAPEAGWS